MGSPDWFRRSTWTVTDQQEFRESLNRCRSESGRAQYLRIQAVHLETRGFSNRRSSFWKRSSEIMVAACSAHRHTINWRAGV